MVIGGPDQHAETARHSFGVGAWFKALLIILISNGLAQLAIFGPAAKGVTMLIAPLFAGLVAGKSGKRPVFQGATACALGTLALLAGESAVTGEYPIAGRDLVPPAFLVTYSTAIGVLGAWITSRRHY